MVLEPDEKFEMLRSFYQARVQQAVTTIRAAASNFSGTASLVVGGGSEGAMLLESGRVSQRDMSLRRATVNVTTLRHLWEQFKPSKVDLLVVDVEGNEPRVFDHPLPRPRMRPRPRLVHFEHAHLSAQQRRSLHFKLTRQGYEFIKETGRPPLDILYGIPSPDPCAAATTRPQLCTEYHTLYREVCAPDGLLNASDFPLGGQARHEKACAKKASPYGHTFTNSFPDWMC